MPTPFYLPSVNDSRNLVKMLVYGAKTISWGLSGCRFSSQGKKKIEKRRRNKIYSIHKISEPDPTYQPTILSPQECAYFVKVVKYGLIALDVYTIIPGNSPNSYQRAPS